MGETEGNDQEPASMQSAAVGRNGRQRGLTPKELQSWGVDGSKPVLAPASSWAAVRTSLQLEEEQESFMLRTGRKNEQRQRALHGQQGSRFPVARALVRPTQYIGNSTNLMQQPNQVGLFR